MITIIVVASTDFVIVVVATVFVVNVIAVVVVVGALFIAVVVFVVVVVVVVVVIIVFVVVLKAYFMNKNAWRRERRKIFSLDLVQVKKIICMANTNFKNPRM